MDAQASRPEGGLLEVYDRALPLVYGYLVSRCGERIVAEDLTSETFLAAAQHGTDAPISVGWLIGVARHKLADHWRRQEREQRLLRSMGAEIPDREDPWDGHIDEMRARQALGQVTPSHRAALTLRYMDGLAVPAVASILGRTVHATEALLVRARRDLRRAYEQGDGHD
jgi:RNA polymerase sigma-70 factor (ECF subfamily)